MPRISMKKVLFCVAFAFYGLTIAAQEPIMRADTLSRHGIDDVDAERLSHPYIPPTPSMRRIGTIGAELPGLPALRPLETVPGVRTLNSRALGLDATEMRLAVPRADVLRADRTFQNDFSQGGAMLQWNGGMITGGSSFSTLPGMMATQSASAGFVQQAGRLTLAAGLSANRYMYGTAMATQFGVNASATYRFDDKWSATVFGSFYNSNPYFSMAAMPYVGSSSYGGYFTYMGKNLGIDFGAERVYDAYARRWTTVPIVTPKVKLNNGLQFDLPVGMLLNDLLRDAVWGGDWRGGGVIVPSMPMPQPRFTPPPSR